MIRAIIFDCFGVLTTDGWQAFKKKHFNDDPDLLAQAAFLNRQVDSGQIPYDDFIAGIAELSGVEKQEVHRLVENNVPNEDIFAVLPELKQHYKIGFLSNAGDNWLESLFGKERPKLFDVVCLSCETGFVKPDLAAYMHAAKRLGLKPEECVLIDDQQIYIAGAIEAGMEAIHYQDFDQAWADLRRLLSSSEN
jgi:putative hydrolase of the HAD superfamily